MIATIKVKGGLRCACCFGDAQGLLEGCACGVLVHADCRRSLGRCPTLGCGAESAQGCGVEPHSPSRPRAARLRAAEAANPRPISALRRLWIAASGAKGRIARYAAAVAITLGLTWTALAGSTCSVGPSSERRLAALATRVQIASHNYYADHRRWPQSLEELCGHDAEHGPYLELDRWDAAESSLMWRGREAWLAVEDPNAPRSVRSVAGGPRVELVRVLFVREDLGGAPRVASGSSHPAH